MAKKKLARQNLLALQMVTDEIDHENQSHFRQFGSVPKQNANIANVRFSQRTKRNFFLWQINKI